MTVAAVALTPAQISSLRAMGVIYSKELSVQRVIELVDVVKANSLDHHIMVF